MQYCVFGINCTILKLFLIFMFTYFVVYLFTDEPWKFNFEVKFYPPDPAQLQEDITRFVISGINCIH